MNDSEHEANAAILAELRLEIHNRFREENKALRALLAQAKEALLLSAPAIDERSSTYQSIKDVLEKMNESGL